MSSRSACLLLLIALAGCGPSGPAMVPVSGTVLLDGQPVADADVTFVPVGTGKTAAGETKTNAEGKFTLKTEKPGDGALEGEYKVAVSGLRTTGVVVGEDGTSADVSKMKQEWFVPKQFANADTSGLRQTVSKGMPAVELKLSSK